MIKRNIIIFMAVSLGLLGLISCNSTSSLSAEGNIISLKITYAGSSMLQYTGYSYHIREENGEILFDAHFYIVGKNVREITLEKIAATQEDMEALREICGKYNFAEAPVYKESFLKKIFSKQIKDGPVNKVIFEIIWENGAELVTSPGKTSDLLNFFKELAIRLDE